MKKNKMMRLASFLLVAVLLTTSIISGTFAKYVVEGDITDSARVAKFGVTIAANGSLFAETYYAVGQTNGNMPATGTDNTGNVITVKSSASGQNVVAPGTKNSKTGLGFTVSGTPEVTVKVTAKLEVVDSKNVFLKSGTYTDVTGADKTFTLSGDYYPIVWTLKKGTQTLVDKGTIAQINTKLSEEFNGKVFKPGTDLSGTDGLGDYTLTWEWPFEQTANKDLYNQADTLLGDLAANNPTVSVAATNYSTEISVKLTLTVEQVD